MRQAPAESGLHEQNTAKLAKVGLGVAFFGMIAGLVVMVVGYFIGNDHDRQLTMITVLQE